jgi:hypothetical protein
MELHYWMIEKSIKEIIDEVETSGFIHLFIEIIAPIFLVFLGIILITL